MTPSASPEDGVIQRLKQFYVANPQIKASHGLPHVLAVLDHAKQAVACHDPPLTSEAQIEVLIAALLHDVDDEKYFPLAEGQANHFANAKRILREAQIPEEYLENILFMISIVSCSKNLNSVPTVISENERYYQLIPRWADRIEAVGKKGVVRCYRYNQEKNLPLSSSKSPRPATAEEVWSYASPDRFIAYQSNGGSSTDMISHYYDKLLHVACPPPGIVRNKYLEEKLKNSSKELLEVCRRFGQTGVVDEDYIRQLEKECQ